MSNKKYIGKNLNVIHHAENDAIILNVTQSYQTLKKFKMAAKFQNGRNAITFEMNTDIQHKRYGLRFKYNSPFWKQCHHS